ncbi:cbb3-type cytochrome oxidase assembly protein CcoS [Corallincola holothuriorum]|uniref:Cbb3-type cytochrome oxidase assembly protein CcoS n=1 Tax=Corallincola holothuriorum TaxID=2282215 RepID=A0A368NRW8_9GAMM|nr:cbb3-type cytochrome oxidase assembly protein CcoS [Corallincola holothuriorum]RCU52683.1 cbb3-type cytochrome oxidase assembly protein CcoS [Corallincola holothuriorum]
MSILYVLIPIAIIFVFVAIGVFVWAVRSEQFEDLERHGSDILFDEKQNTPVKDATKAQSGKSAK